MLDTPSVMALVRAALLALGAIARKIDRQGICGALSLRGPCARHRLGL
jgi:hypothetical protein